jgi:HlyD family secretion protein
MKSYFRIFIIIILLGGFIWTFYYLYSKSKPIPVVFQTEVPFITDIVNKTVATGTVGPEKEIDIKSIVPGIVEEVYVEAGQYVKKGDVLARVRLVPEMLSLSNAENRLRKAEIEFQNVKRIFERQKKVFEDKVISESEFQQAEIPYLSAQQEVTASEENLRLIKEGVTSSSSKISNTLIRSTIDGMVLDVGIKEGYNVIPTNNFNEGTTIASIAEMDKIVFKGKIDESEVGKIKKGMPLLIYVGAIQNDTFYAELEYISPKGKTLDKEGKGAIQFDIRARVKLKDNQFLRAGYSANGEIIMVKKEKVLAIHESLVQFKKDSIFVEVETQPNIYRKKPVKLGVSDGINVEVISGIEKNDKIKVQTNTTEQNKNS